MRIVRMGADLPVKFESSGLFVADEGWTHSRREIESFEIIAVMDGTLYIRQEEESFVLTKNDVLLLLPNVEHFGFKEVEKGTSFYWTHFTPRRSFERVKDVPDSGGRGGDIYLPICFRRVQAERIIVLFNQLCHINESRYLNAYATDYIMTSLLVEISEQFLRTARPSLRPSKMEKVLEWIRVNSDKSISLVDVANEFHYSREYLSRQFHSANGITMQKYINSLRISKAKALLMQSDYQIKEITEIVGISDEKYFQRLFKEFVRMSPGQFRNAYSKRHFNNK